MTTIEHLTSLPEPIQITRQHRGGYWYDIAINGRRFRAYYDQRCKVCNSPDDTLRQLHVLSSMRQTPMSIYRTLGEAFEDGKPPFSITSLRNHLNKHVPEYERFGRALEAASVDLGGGLAPKRVQVEALSQMIVNRGFAMLADGTVDLSVSEMLGAAKLLYELERNREDQGDARLYRDAMLAMITEVRKSLPPDRFDDFMWGLRANPSMAEIISGGSGSVISIQPNDVEDAEEVAPLPELPPAPVSDYADILMDL